MITRLFEAVANREKETGAAISDADLARAAKVNQAAVDYWRKTATASLKSEHVFRLADFLNIDARWLVEGPGKRFHVVVNPGANVLRADNGIQIANIIKRLQSMQSELQAILSEYQGLPSVESATEPSHDKENSSPRAKVDRLMAAAKLPKRRNEGKEHGKHRSKSPGGSKAG